MQVMQLTFTYTVALPCYRKSQNNFSNKFSKLQQQQNVSSKDVKKVNNNKPTSAPPKSAAPSPPKSNNNAVTLQSNANGDPNNLITVMIPRAKYYSQQMPAVSPEIHCQQNQHQHQHPER